MFKINLVPEVQEKKNQVQKMNATSVTASVVIMAVTIVLLILVSLAQATIRFQLTQTEKKILAVQKESEQYRELEETVVSLEKGLAGIKEIYDGKNQWVKLLAHIEAATPNEVTFKNLKIGNGTIEAAVEARTVDSLAKLIDSYKNYQILSLTGTGVPNQDLKVALDGSEIATVRVKSNGQWVLALKTELGANHEVKVGEGEKFSTISYKAEGQKIEGTDGAMGTIKNLFSSVETQSYEKGENGSLKSTINFNYDGGSLW